MGLLHDLKDKSRKIDKNLCQWICDIKNVICDVNNINGGGRTVK